MSGKAVSGLNDQRLLADDFNAAEYVNGFLKETRPGEEVRKLQGLRSHLNASSVQASEQIKDIVFDHYRQFIDTSKEITGLEREIYELSTLLSDQKNVIEGLMELCGQDRRSSCSVSIHSAGNSQQNPLQSLIHKVEGIADVLNNLKSTEKIVLMTEMTLLDETTMESLHPIFLVLLSETFIIAAPSDSSSRLRFQLVSTQRLENVAIVNVKRAQTQHSYAELIIQLIIFPEQLFIKCESARVKRQWLEGIESAKRLLEQEKSLHRQATIRAKRRKSSTAPHPNDPRARLQKFSQNNSVIHEQEDEFEATNRLSSSPEPNPEDTQWLSELVNELHDVISHRHMEEAVDMLKEWKQCVCHDAKLNARFAALEKNVIKILSDEVRRPGPLHGGARALSQPLKLLNELNRATYAMELYLKRRTACLTTKTRELTISEDPLSYVRQVSRLFVTEILDVAGEFVQQKDRYCLVLHWSCKELCTLLSLIKRHVIEVATSMAVLSRTWDILLNECYRLTEAGIDLTFEIHRLLEPALRVALEGNFSNILESIRLRTQEERWQPFNLETEQSLNRYLEEMSDFGLSIDWAVSSEPANSLNLAHSACHFSRTAHALSRDLALLKSSSHLSQLTDSFICKLWEEFCKSLEEAPQSELHTLTCQFINQVVIRCEEIYYDEDGLIRNMIKSRFPRLARFITQRRVSNSEEDDEEIANV
ncbi:Exocyst complex component 8 [Aphelenchoides bicaudatus]|nr:Exocyst complex component 8 [Aphelenchoides bicaudatus]